MEDAADLKSASLTGVGVRIPSWAPPIILQLPHAVPYCLECVAERPRIGTQSCRTCPSLSRLKCGNICGNTFVCGRTTMALSATRVRTLKDPGRYSDGGGLHLFIGKTGRKSWVLRITVDGRRRDIGLGDFRLWALPRPGRKQQITGPPWPRAAIPWPKGALPRCRPSGKPPSPFTRRTYPLAQR